jgi:hypothetical protein
LFAGSFLKYWAGLQGENDKQMILEGAKIMQDTALSAHRDATRGSNLRITEAGESSDNDL